MKPVDLFGGFLSLYKGCVIMPQYFEKNENLIEKPMIVKYEFLGKSFSLHTNTGVFSKDKIDDGTYAFLKVLVPRHLSGKILDVGCGYGALGLTLASFEPEAYFTLIDVNERALELCKKNIKSLNLNNVTCLQSDVYQNVEGLFNSIVINPPIRAGKKVIYSMFAGAYDHLIDGGSLFIVIRKSHGAHSACDYITSIFGSCTLLKKDKGYYIYESKKMNKENL